MEKGLVTTACACTDHTRKTWYLVPRTSLQKRGPKYEAIPHLALYSGLIFSGEGLSMRYLTYQVSIVRLAHAHAVVPRHIRESLGDKATDDELIEQIHNFHVLSIFVSVCTVFSIASDSFNL